jgi:hypothetical protein
MPKLDITHLEQRLRKRHEEMLRGDEVAIRDIKALLNAEQQQWMNDEWAKQQTLRKQKRARTEEEKMELGYKSKRDIQIEALARAVVATNEGLLDGVNEKLEDKEIRQARIFLDEFFAARDKGKEFWSAWSWANNALTRAALPRVDGGRVGTISGRDKEVWAVEDALREKIREQMTDDEREQQDLLAESNRQSSIKSKKNA